MKKSKEIKRSKKKQQGLTKNQIITSIIVSAIVIVFSVILGIIATNTGQETVPLLESSTAIESVSIQKDNGFKIERDGDEWNILDRLETTDQEAVNLALTWLSQWSGEEVEVNRRNVGLDFPSHSIQVNYDDNSSKRLSIGQRDPTDSYFYIEDHELSQIFLVDRRLVDQFPLEVVNYLDLNVLSWSVDQLESIIINRESENIHLTTNSPYPPEETTPNVAGWFIDEPYNHTHNVSYAQMQEITETLDHFQMNEIVTDDVTDWAEYGLDSSELSVEFMTEDDQMTLIVGDEETPESYYARIEGMDEVITIPANSINVFNQSPEDFHDGYVKIIAINELNQLAIESEQLSVDVTISHLEEERKQFRVDDEVIFEDVFREAYTTLAGLRAVGSSESATYQEPEVVITSTIRLEEGEKDVVLELVDYDDEHYAAFIDQESDFLVEKRAVNNMLVAIQLAIDY